VLEGAVRRAGNRIRVTAELIKVPDGFHLWSERYDREMTDVFLVQDEMSQAIVAALKLKLSTAPTPTPPQRAPNQEAYHAYLKGRHYLYKYTAEGLAKSKERFERATSLEPAYALAYSGLAEYYATLAVLGAAPPREELPLAKAAAERALSIDNSVAEAHAIVGLVGAWLEYNWEAAERAFQQALQIRPVPAIVRYRYAFYCLMPRGRNEEAAQQMRLALERDPLFSLLQFGEAYTLHLKRQFDRSIDLAQKALVLDPGNWLLHFQVGWSSFQKGSIEQSIAALRKAFELAPEYSWVAGLLAGELSRAGRTADAQDIVAQYQERNRHRYVSPFGYVLYYVSRGEAERALETLEKALESREPVVLPISADPYFQDTFQGEPRYESLLRKMGLR
jgi:tetratricopeptide (TPR) repeat protein